MQQISFCCIPVSRPKTVGDFPDSKVHGANMGPTWGRQDPGERHVGHVNRVSAAVCNRIAPMPCVVATRVYNVIQKPLGPVFV